MNETIGSGDGIPDCEAYPIIGWVWIKTDYDDFIMAPICMEQDVANAQLDMKPYSRKSEIVYRPGMSADEVVADFLTSDTMAAWYRNDERRRAAYREMGTG